MCDRPGMYYLIDLHVPQSAAWCMTEGVFNREHPGGEVARGPNALRPTLGVGSSGVSKNKPVLPCAPKLFGIFQLENKENKKSSVCCFVHSLNGSFWPKSAW